MVTLRRVDVHHQAGPEYGELQLVLDGEPRQPVAAVAADTEDWVLAAPRGMEIREVELRVTGGPVPLYGVVLETAEALIGERGDRVGGSMIKQTLKRRRPDVSETAYGFRSFSGLLEEAEARGLVEMDMDERSGGYIVRATHRE